MKMMYGVRIACEVWLFSAYTVVKLAQTRFGMLGNRLHHILDSKIDFFLVKILVPYTYIVQNVSITKPRSSFYFYIDFR